MKKALTILKTFSFSENLRHLFFLLSKHKFSSITLATVVNFNAKKREKKKLKFRKAKYLEYIFILCIGFMGSAQNDALFNRATEAYNKGNYNEAIVNYIEIIENGQHSAELYFNLGNSYYKLNKVAPSVYFFEKALLLKPNDNEIKTNLSYARNMTLDAIEVMPETGFSKVYNAVIGFLSFDQWAYLAVCAIILFVLLYIAFYYFRYSTRKRIAFILGLISLFVAISAVIFGFVQYNNFLSNQPAIVFAEEVAIKSEPNDRSQEVFKLHEGTKLNVVEELNDWKKIKIANGKTGWTYAKNIKMLRDF